MEQTTPARKRAPAKDNSFFGAFQGLSLDGLMGDGNGSAAIAAPGGDQCKVMWGQWLKGQSDCLNDPHAQDTLRTKGSWRR